ncbi:hypothetical protein Leryth_004991 [Lithospermum erythrorhizon]|nr:hypothetical protein Leryth_004991 [Lithospermum erythrorhizon]
MSQPLLAIDKKESSVSPLTSLPALESTPKEALKLKERNYMGLSTCSSVDSSNISPTSEGNFSGGMYLKETELRLGLPGSVSPPRDSEFFLSSTEQLDEKPLFPLHPSTDGIYTVSDKIFVLGNKRGFSDAMNGFPEGKFGPDVEVNIMLSPKPLNSCLKGFSLKENAGSQLAKLKDTTPKTAVQEIHGSDAGSKNVGMTTNNSSAPAPKAQVVGWPPIRSFRKNTLASTSKITEDIDEKPGAGAQYVKVSMDGAPFLRKVDLRTYSTYQELSSALEKMFSCFTIGQYGSHGASGKEMLSERKLKDLLHGSEYVVTYEDKDGDWMLVGDVPWDMFLDTCKRLRIMKSSDAIGLAPRAAEKSQSKN